MRDRTNADYLKRADSALAGPSFGVYCMPDEVAFVVAAGEGCRVYDIEGRAYLDYALGGGPLILGHAHPAVVEAVVTQIRKGSTYYALNDAAIELAEEIVQAAPCGESLKFCSSGAEATFYALRIARAATGREKILKFEGAYHGHHDYAMMSTTPKRPEPFPKALPDSAGTPAAIGEGVLVAPFNDLPETVRIMERYANDLAAVIVEPQCRLIEPTAGFLEGLRKATQRIGAVLIFDELVTGFRLAYGGAQERYGVVPDLACYGKIIGGGLPLAAVVGPRSLIELTDPRRSDRADGVFLSGTLNGYALGARAGLATLRELRKPGTYARLEAVGLRMRKGLGEIAARAALPAQVLGSGPLANVYFSSKAITDYRTLQAADRRLSAELTKQLLKRGVLVSMTTKIYVSLAHGDADIDATLRAVEKSLEEIRG